MLASSITTPAEMPKNKPETTILSRKALNKVCNR